VAVRWLAQLYAKRVGTLSGSGFSPVLNVSTFIVMVILADAEPTQVTNCELGVVLRLETPENVETAVAWERPARKYGRGDVPWASPFSTYSLLGCISFRSHFSIFCSFFTKDSQTLLADTQPVLPVIAPEHTVS
jgi:hypothetical protein